MPSATKNIEISPSKLKELLDLCDYSPGGNYWITRKTKYFLRKVKGIIVQPNNNGTVTLFGQYDISDPMDDINIILEMALGIEKNDRQK